jgi:hypothetical protein
MYNSDSAQHDSVDFKPQSASDMSSVLSDMLHDRDNRPSFTMGEREWHISIPSRAKARVRTEAWRLMLMGAAFGAFAIAGDELIGVGWRGLTPSRRSRHRVEIGQS